MATLTLDRSAIKQYKYDMASRRHSASLDIEDIPLPAVIGSFRVMQICNQAYCDLFGYDRLGLVGKSFRLIYLSNDEYVRSGAIWNSQLEKKLQYSDERIMRRSDGTTFWCRVTGRSLDPRNPTSRAIWLVQPLLRPVTSGVSELTRRQRQMISLVAQGKSNREIASELGLSVRTAETHRARIMKKVGVANTAELVGWYAGLQEPGR